MVFVKTIKTTNENTKTIREEMPIPNQRTNNGAKAIRGVLFIIVINGAQNLFSNGFNPMTNPNKLPTKSPIKNPAKAAFKVAKIFGTNKPCSFKNPIESTTLLGGARNSGLTKPDRATHSQKRRNTTIVINL
jgi:hypothetical protein